MVVSTCVTAVILCQDDMYIFLIDLSSAMVNNIIKIIFI